jgi:hypothetical protein
MTRKHRLSRYSAGVFFPGRKHRLQGKDGGPDRIQDERRGCAGERGEAEDACGQEHDGGPKRDSRILEVTLVNGIKLSHPEMRWYIRHKAQPGPLSNTYRALFPYKGLTPLSFIDLVDCG